MVRIITLILITVLMSLSFVYNHIQMNFLRNIKPIAAEISSLPKFYNSHVWITPPASDGVSYLGISDFAKHYFVRLNKILLDNQTKTNYGMKNRFYIEAFIKETKEQREAGQLIMSQKLEWERFAIKKNEPFALLQAIEFDIQLLAPVDMRVLQLNSDCQLLNLILSVPYLFKVQLLDPLQLQTLMTQDQYAKSKKMFMY